MNQKLLSLYLIAIAIAFPASGKVKNKHKSEEAQEESTGKVHPVLWRNPSDISSRNLFYGPGGKEHEPHSTYTFVKEDLSGSNPKFVVRDEIGVEWKVKMGAEAKPETVASRLVWAVGYLANEDYFVADLRVQGLPSHLHRGQNRVSPDGLVHAVRLKRDPKDEKKVGNWHWRQNVFTGTRELNGLRVMMAMINNWDLLDENNAIYAEKGSQDRIYMVSDLGASFGTAGATWPLTKSKGNLVSYRHSKFITKTKPEYVSFEEPGPPSLLWFFYLKDYFRRWPMRRIGRNIPRADVKWIGDLLGQLSPDQIRDAFRAAGYSSQEVDGFAGVVQERIAALKAL
jgi:hypothetical protein